MSRQDPMLPAITTVPDHLLQRALEQAWSDVPFYRELWRDQWGEKPPTATPAFEDWPTWGVGELRRAIEQYPPYGNLYVPDADHIAYIHSSTGTTGKPRMFPVYSIDMPSMVDMYAAHFGMFGVTNRDVGCITATLGLPRGAWSYLHAFEAMGATVVPASSGRVTPAEKLLGIIFEAGVTVLQGTGSYLTYLTRRAEEFGFVPSESQVRMLISGGESVPAEVRRHLEEAWGAELYMNFASTDLSWVASECSASSRDHGRRGMHVFNEQLLVEILDENREPVMDETYGELVVTSWVRPSTPRIRFRTGDRAALSMSPCPCGRDEARILPIDGRIDEAIRFRGQTIWAASVDDILTKFAGKPVEFLMNHRPTGQTDVTELILVLAESDKPRLAHINLEESLRDRLNVRFNIEFVPAGSLAEMTGIEGTGKTKRVLDNTRP